MVSWEARPGVRVSSTWEWRGRRGAEPKTITGTGEIVPTPERYYAPGSIRDPTLAHVKWDSNGAVTPEFVSTLTKVPGEGDAR
ncbi:hypothetical protein [Candidatus Solirubrobacter pratensis]|uniref:hypothetical protein n=1 Tax=Candidatus Solirubrobacter pratensis TaxID=1298857 RepID=UPI000487F273|nr:hypothetical protein [Candidatus Solirubrobacter pratensis]